MSLYDYVDHSVTIDAAPPIRVRPWLLVGMVRRGDSTIFSVSVRLPRAACYSVSLVVVQWRRFCCLNAPHVLGYLAANRMRGERIGLC